MAAHSRVTLSSLRARLTDRVGGAGPFWSDEEKNDSINEALCIWSALTGEFTRTVTVPALPLGVIFQDDAFDAGSFQIHDASVSFFFVPTQIASLLRVSWNGAPLALVSAFELDNGYVGWQDITGTPLYWTPVGVSIFAVYPAPTSGTFTLDGLKENVRLVSDGDFVDLGDEEITKLLDYAHFYCLAPDTKILFDDLIWRPIGEAKVGDGLLGFDEQNGKRRRWRKSMVLGRQEFTLPCLRLTFDDGTSIVCSTNHSFLVRTYPSGGNNDWRSAGTLKVGSRVLKPLDVWSTDNSYDGGYLAAGLDGEGHLIVDDTKRRYILGFSQKSNLMLERFILSLVKGGYEFRLHTNRESAVHMLVIRSKADLLRLLGSVQPKRLLPTLDIASLGVMHSKSATITQIEDLGPQAVVNIETSTKTFIAEGLASHNSSFKEATGEFQTGQTALKRLFEAAALRNSRFKATNTFRRAMGLSKDDLEKPARAEGGDIGVRA